MSLIITAKYLIDNSVISQNTDFKLITPTINFVQDLYIHPILGTDLYNEIIGQIDASTPGTDDAVSAANITLLNSYVLPTLLWYVMCECPPVFKYRMMNKGVMVQNTENSAPADLSEIKFMMDRWKNNAEAYAERCTRFLRANTTTYPLYLQNTDANDIKPNKNNYTSSLYLDDCTELPKNISIDYGRSQEEY